MFDAGRRLCYIPSDGWSLTRLHKEMNDESDTVWIDVVTLVVPRLTVSEMAASLFKHVLRGGAKLRWVVHIDPIPEMSGDLDACMDEVGRISELFDDSDIALSPKRIGHPASFFNAMQRTRNSCIYLEDDKVFTRSPDFSPFLSGGIDYMNLSSKRLLCPNTCAGIWNRRTIDYVLDSRSSFSGNVEQWLKHVCRHAAAPFNFVKGFRCTEDIGAHSLAKHGLVRVMMEDGNPVYVKGEDVTFVVWEENAAIERLEGRRRETMCSESYPTIFLRRGEKLDIGRIATRFTFFFSSDAFPECKSRGVFANDETFSFVDLVGDPDDPTMFAVARTDLFRAASPDPAPPSDILKRTFHSVPKDRIRPVRFFATRGGSMHSNKRLKWIEGNDPVRSKAAAAEIESKGGHAAP